MRIALLATAFLLVNLAVFANPFVGSWQANDTFKVSVSDTIVSVTVDTQGKIGVGDYPYTYDEGAIRIGTAVLVYDLPDSDTIGLLGFIKGTPTFIILVRNTTAFVPQKESLAL